jgi:hypothetical protein
LDKQKVEELQLKTELAEENADRARRRERKNRRKDVKRPNPFDALFTARHRLMHPVAMDILQR